MNDVLLSPLRLSELENLIEKSVLRGMAKTSPSPIAPPDELLTPEETAQLLKVTKVTVWDWAKRGILQKHTIGNQVRYLRSEVLAAATKKRA